jgi:hypothetical protein
MDRLWALKRDFDPFGKTFFGFSAVGFVLHITRCTLYRCPYCRWIFKLTWGPSNSLLGSGERACWHCKQTFWDDSDEWPEMSGQDRYSFLLPITIAGYLAAVLLTALLLAYSQWYFEKSVKHVDPTAAIVFVLPLLAWFAFRSVQVIRSIRRYNDRGTTRPL